VSSVLTNPRRRRSALTVMTLVFIGVLQGPNLYFNVVRGDAFKHRTSSDKRKQRSLRPDEVDLLLTAERFVPPLWLSVAAKDLAEGDPSTALYGLVGGSLIAAGGLLRAYRGTVRAYRGEGDSLAGGPSTPDGIAAARPRGRALIELRAPFLSEQASAVMAA